MVSGVSVTQTRHIRHWAEQLDWPSEFFLSRWIFRVACDRLQDKNEARIIKDLMPLHVPSVETLATFDAEHLDHLVESVNEGWNNCVPLTRPRPQPDYAVGFGTICLHR